MALKVLFIIIRIVFSVRFISFIYCPKTVSDPLEEYSLPANFLAGEDIFNNIKKNSYDQ
jgi:hypothetical protein